MNKTDIHPIQSEILCKLLFVHEASFSELNKEKYGSDLFSFHLKQLMDENLIEKETGGKYGLTAKGKEFANRFDTEAKEVERQPKVGVLVICIRKTKRGKEYLVQQRLKQPYFGFWGFMTGKMKWGETVEEAVKRELTEETDLGGRVELISINHKMDYDENGKILEDKFFLVNRVINPTGTLKENFEGGRNCWMTKKEIFDLDNLFDGLKERIDMVENKALAFGENKYQVKGY